MLVFMVLPQPACLRKDGLVTNSGASFFSLGLDKQGMKRVFPHWRNILFQKVGDKKENKPSRVRDVLLLSEPQSDDVFVTI